MQPEILSLTTAPRHRDIILRKPNGLEVRACWWHNWVDPDSDERPWAWRVARPDGTVGEPIEEAIGWREIDA